MVLIMFIRTYIFIYFICLFIWQTPYNLQLWNIKTNKIKWNDKMYTYNPCRVWVLCCLVTPGHEGIIPSTANVIPGHEGIIPSTANDKPDYYTWFHTNKSYLTIKNVLKSNCFKHDITSSFLRVGWWPMYFSNHKWQLLGPKTSLLCLEHLELRAQLLKIDFHNILKMTNFLMNGF